MPIITAHDPDAGDIVTLRIDSVEAYGNNSAANLAGATFSTPLPITASGTAVTTMQWIPQREHLGFIAFHFSATDQHGNTSSEVLIYFVDIPLIIAPVPPLQLAANEAFEIVIPVEDADWHQLGWAELLDGYPAWLQLELVALHETGAENAIRLYGKPGPADAGSHKASIYVRALFGKEAVIELQLNVASCQNQTWYRDKDGDGFGTNRATLTSCSAPQGYVNNSKDCNDEDAAIHPDAVEATGDGLDNNCNGQIDEVNSCLAQSALSVTATCSDNSALRRWKIYNPNNCAVAIEWQLHKTQQKGSLIAPPGESYFTTASLPKGPELVNISWKNSKGKSKSKKAAASSAKCKGKKEAKRNIEPSLAISNKPAGMLAYPMPFHDRLNLHHDNFTSTARIKLLLYSINGQQFDLSNAISTRAEGSLVLAIDGHNIPAGIYILKVWADDRDPVFIKVIKDAE